MTEDEDFTNLRYIDLGLATKIGKPWIGGTIPYMPVKTLTD